MSGAVRVIDKKHKSSNEDYFIKYSTNYLKIPNILFRKRYVNKYNCSDRKSRNVI